MAASDATVAASGSAASVATSVKRLAGDAPRRLFAAFIGDEILQEWGRLPYAVLHPFLASGFEVQVYDNLRSRLTAFEQCEERDLPQPAQLTLGMRGVTFTSQIPDHADEFIYLFDYALDIAKRRPWMRRVHLKYDTFSSYWLRSPLLAPYAMHPAQTELATAERIQQLRSMPRTLRSLFAGDSKGYVRRWVRYPEQKLPRHEVLKVLKDRLGDHLIAVAGADEIAQLCAAGYVDKFVLSDSGTGITPERWLPTMALADFFLCPPGIVMPMCHNVIEAMAVGTIPLISYAEWFHPNLRHLHDCVVYGGPDDLAEKMRLVLAMPQADVARMRANVIDYYESHLRPEVVVQAIESRPEAEVTLLLHTELNMAQNSARLNGRSVLIKGPDADGPLRWVGRTLDRYVGRSSGS